MASQNINLDQILRVVIWCIALSSLAALAWLFFGHVEDVRGAAGGIGGMTAITGSGVAIWFSIRSRDKRFVVAALLSVLPLAFWCWTIYQVVHE